MKKLFVAPQLQVIALCEEDILTLSGVNAANAMELDIAEILNSNNSGN